MGGLFGGGGNDAPPVSKEKLAEDTKQATALKEKQEKRAARRVQTILTGPSGLVEETEKKQRAQGVLGGNRTPLG